MVNYKVPTEHYFRIHHVRPRFKDNVEQVLLYIATNLSQINPENKKEFNKKFDMVLKKFPGNITKTKKTIANWRTEISSLFGFVVELNNDTMYAGDNAKMLAERQDLLEFFKYFLYTFQYPGGHMKSHETAKIIKEKIKFKPVYYILNLLYHGEKISKKRFGINKAEATHCIFNDLRVTRNQRKVVEVLKLIEKNRKNNLNYDWNGDVIRYAGDILDYLVIANILVKHGNNFYLNEEEQEAIDYFINHNMWFNGYDHFYNSKFSLADVNNISNLWFLFVNSYARKVSFKTDLLQYLGVNKTSYQNLVEKSLKTIRTTVSGTIPKLLAKAQQPSGIKTKEIGDAGEALVYGHECMTLKNASRKDLIPKVVMLPNHLAMGYDIRSYDPKAKIKHIEVKTTISYSSLVFNEFHLTDNEWNVASNLLEKYYVYRLQMNRKSGGGVDVKLFVIKDPITMYKKGFMKVKSRNGMEVKFKQNAGSLEELLIWKN